MVESMNMYTGVQIVQSDKIFKRKNLKEIVKPTYRCAISASTFSTRE